MRFTWCLAAALASFALLLAPGAKAQYSDNKIKIGILDDFSGPYCVDNCMGPVVATQMAVDEFGGKINGVPIEVIHGDHQDKPDVGVSIANGGTTPSRSTSSSTSSIRASRSRCRKWRAAQGKAVLYSEAGSDDLTGTQCAPYSAQWTYDTYQLPNLGEAVPKLGKTWFILSADYAYRQGAGRGRDPQCHEGGRQDRRHRVSSLRRVRHVVLHAPGAGLEGRGRRARRRRSAT